MKQQLPLLFILLLLGGPVFGQSDLKEDFERNARRAAPRDAFPVFNDPEMVSADEGDGFLRPSDWVIGVAMGGEAKAYPVAIMGVHELGNDVCGETPIAVSW